MGEFFSENSPPINRSNHQMLNPDNATLEWCAKWIEDSLRAETNERTIEFGRNMAMTIRAVKTKDEPLQPTGEQVLDLGAPNLVIQRIATTPPTTPSDAAMRVAREWLRSERAAMYSAALGAAPPQALPPQMQKQEDDAVERLAAIITRHLAAPVESEACAWCKQTIETAHIGRDGRRYCSVGCQAQYEEETRRAGSQWKSAAATTTPETPVACSQFCRDGWIDELEVSQDGLSNYTRQVPCEVCRVHCDPDIPFAPSPETPVGGECVGCIASRGGLGRCRIHEPATADNEGDCMDSQRTSIHRQDCGMPDCFICYGSKR